MKKIFFIIVMSLAVGACTESDEGLESHDSPLVVEGWIEDGGYPVVILTRAFPVNKDYRNVKELENYLVRWAKVTVDNGEESVVLTGKVDNGYFPPYIYTTGRMRGVAGKKYNLTVEYRDERVTATTTIPFAPTGCSLKVSPCQELDSLYQIVASFKDNRTEKNYYQFFTRVGTQSKHYQASYLGTIDDEVIDDVTEVPVYRGFRLGDERYTPYFYYDDTVSVKFSQIDETSFRFWDSYTKEISLSGNLFLSSASNISTNVVGGLGYWCGYGSITNYIIIREKLE